MDWAETWRVVAPMAAPLSGAAIGAWGLLRGSRVVKELRELTELRSDLPAHLHGVLDDLIAKQLELLVTRRSRKVNVGNAVALVVLVLLAVGVIWGLAYAASQSSGVLAVLLNGAVVLAAALALFFCAAGATTLFDDPNVARERAEQRKAAKRLRRQGRP